MKRICILLLAAMLLLVACGEAAPAPAESSSESSLESSLESTGEASSEGGECGTDMVPPAFVNAKNGKLPGVSHDAGEEVDLLSGIAVMDNRTATEKLQVFISDDGGYDPHIPGTYVLTVSVTDGFLNESTATLEVTVLEIFEKITVTLGGEIPYKYNDTSALAYTSSGTSFRTADVIQVMDKEFFLAEYEAHKAEHTNNGTVPFFPNGVIVITDRDGVIVQVRIAAGANVEMNADGSVKTSGLSWTNSIDAVSGGGMFKGLAEELDTLLPDGGQLLFVGNPGQQVCRKFLIKSLFDSDYVSGEISSGDCDIRPCGGTIVLE